MKTKITLLIIALLAIVTACTQRNSEFDELEVLANEPIYSEVDQLPVFDGGMTTLYKYISSNIIYPEQARIEGIEGKIFVEFVISKDGSIKNTRILRGINSECDNEALRVVSQMPSWKPGIYKDQAVNIKMVLPITFKLN